MNKKNETFVKNIREYVPSISRMKLYNQVGTRVFESFFNLKSQQKYDKELLYPTG